MTDEEIIRRTSALECGCITTSVFRGEHQMLSEFRAYCENHGAICNCNGGDQGEGLLSLPHEPQCPKTHHMKKGDSTVCGAPRVRGNSYYEWAYVDCPACRAGR